MKAKIKFTDEVVEVIGYDSEKMALRVKSEKDGKLFCVPFTGLEELKIVKTEDELLYVEVGGTLCVYGRKLTCKEVNSFDGCDGCFFQSHGICQHCCPEQRKDNKNVIFVESKDER